MSHTSASLLERLRLQPDDAAWQRPVDLYTPLIHTGTPRARRVREATGLRASQTPVARYPPAALAAT